VSREELIQMIADRHIFKGVVPDESWYEDLANDIEAGIKKARFEVAKDIYMAVGITDNPLDTLQAKCDRCQEIMAVNKEEVNDGGTKTVS